MVLVHGWGADARSNWIDTGWVDALQPYRRLVAIDVRGHGHSDKPLALEPYSYAAMSRDVIAVMNALAIEAADFIGYSMGAFMGASLLGSHPGRFRSMVLGGIGDETDTSIAQSLVIARALRAPDASQVDNAAGRAVRRFVESNPTSDLESLACSALRMWPEGYPLDLAGSGIARAVLPVLIVNGEDDHPYVDSADRLADALPNARHLVVPGTDHLTTVTDNRFKRAVIDFLSSD